jgi:putative hydrolase of the HAD superfamily
MLVLFDVDDTLLDHSAASRSAAIALHRTLDTAIGVDDFVTSWSAALDRHYERYLRGEIDFNEQRRARVRDTVGSSLSNDDADEVFSRYLAAYENSWRLFPDVLGCLDRLSACRLGVISNGSVGQQRKKLSRTGIADRFACVVISDECGWTKPSAEIFHYACRIAGETPRDSAYIGDRYDTDAEPARRAGLVGIWLDRRHVRTSRHQDPVINTLEQLSVSLCVGR